MERDLDSIKEAVKTVEEALAAGVESGKFMAVVWHVDEKGEMFARRVSWEFPTSRAREEEAFDLLHKVMPNREKLEAAPLPMADMSVLVGGQIPTLGRGRAGDSNADNN